MRGGGSQSPLGRGFRLAKPFLPDSNLLDAFEPRIKGYGVD
jgi:hypothetical protein